MKGSLIFTRIVYTTLLMFIISVCYSYPFLEGLYDGERTVVSGIAVIDGRSVLALSYGDFEGQLDTIYFNGIEAKTHANIRYESNNQFYSVASSIYNKGEKYISTITLLDKNFDIINTRSDSLEVISEYTSHCVDSLGNIYIIGLKGNDGGNSNDVWIRKFDKELQLIWEMSYGAPGVNDYGKDALIDGDYLIAIGEGMDSESGTLDPYLRKIDPETGEELMKVNFGDPETFDGCQELYMDSDGNYIVVGENPVLPERIFKFITAKITKDGEIIELKYHGSEITNDAAFSIRETSWGYIAVGYSDEYTDNGVVKRAIAMTLDRDLNLVKEYIYPISYGHATDIVVIDGSMYAIGMAFQSENAGILWDLTPYISFISVNDIDKEQYNSTIVDIEALSKLYDTDLVNREYEIYDITGSKLSYNELINTARTGIFFIITNDKIYKVQLISAY